MTTETDIGRELGALADRLRHSIERAEANIRALNVERVTHEARRLGETFKDTPAGRRVDEAYGAWMQARAAAGDAFALSLGYVGDGSWSLDVWLKNHEKRSRRP